MEDALYICRFMQFASAMVVFGSSAFRFYALGGGAPPGGTAFEGWLRRVVLVSAVFALASALATLLCQSAAMAGAAAAAFDPETVAAVLLETRSGRV
jgi:putative copper resistance protein D